MNIGGKDTEKSQSVLLNEKEVVLFRILSNDEG